jgi:hypothetical protein
MVSLLFVLQRAENTMKNTMLRKSFKMLEKIPIEHRHTAP